MNKKIESQANKTDTRCVIRMLNDGSYFCGFREDTILVSRAKKNAKVYADSNDPQIEVDIVRIVVLSECTITSGCQLYSAAPDVID